MRREKEGKLRDVYQQLEAIKFAIQVNPMDTHLLAPEKDHKKYNISYWEVEESALKQKSRDQCISLGGLNTTYTI